MAATGAAPMDIKVDLGPMPSDDHSNGIIAGLRMLLDQSELCDVTLLVAGQPGQSFLAHRAVLAAVSTSFHECLTRLGASEGAQTADSKQMSLTLEDITHPEAVRLMLDCIYGPGNGAMRMYNPGSEDINRDVLRLAQRFQISQLQDQAARWLAKDLSTANVLGRFVACEEFGLVNVREKILQQLIDNPSALFVLANDPEIIKVPVVLQDLLVRVLKIIMGVDRDEKAVEKSSEKPCEKSGEKSSEKSGEKSGEKVSEKSGEKVSEKSGEKVGEKVGEKRAAAAPPAGRAAGGKAQRRAGA